jgi:1,4-alpha-glucan branching enzyme
VAAFGRDTESSQQVWSAKEGYPGDPQYRDFYRDIGFDLPLDYIGPYVHPEGHRMATGFKYHAITHEKLHDKWVYNPDIARERAAEHAMDFRVNRQKQAEGLRPSMDRPPIIVSPYDAELYGHWWFEGLQFLDYLFRQICFNQSEIDTITPSEYLDRHPTNQLSVPSASSWGHHGYHEYWLNETNGWIYRHLHVAAERMVELSHRFPMAEGITARALKQAARELVLAESSDWAFIMRTGTTVSYAERRTNAHILQFTRLYDELLRGDVSERWLADLESKDNIFPDMEYRLYAS